LLLADGNNDPLQRAQIIHDVVHSISLIPDNITRSVFITEITKQFQVEESILLNELNKIRKNQLAKKLDEPQISSIQDFNIPQTQPQTQPNTATTKQANKGKEERELIRILMKYGSYAIETEHKPDSSHTHTIEVSVAELIIHELEKDHLTFSKALHDRIYKQICEGIQEKKLYQAKYWLKSADQEIVQLASDFESDNYELSHKWLSKYNIETKTEVDKLKTLVMHAIYTFKKQVILERIGSIHDELNKEDTANDNEKQVDLLAELILLEKIKLKFAQHLNQTIC
jgi:DNA primase